MTWRPQAANTIATTTTASPSQRYIFTSRAARATALALPCAFALHLAFPRTDIPYIAPFALAGLFAAWMRLGPRAAAAVGYLAGLVFFGASFAWFGETAGALLGPFGPLLDIGPAAIEAVAFALAGAIAALAAQRLRGAWPPVVAAAGFTVAEWLRSGGVLGAPLYQVGAAFVDTPLAPLAAFAGVYGVTFAVALVAAAGAAFALAPGTRNGRRFGVVVAAVGLAGLSAWGAWPARAAAPATLRVAAVQGNIRQTVKWQPGSLATAVERYTTLTASLRDFKPQFVLWPETVITTDLLIDPALAAVPANAALVAESRRLDARFAALARSLDSVIAIGTNEAGPAKAYNDLVFYDPHGEPRSAYRKRRLVPFAEFLPGPAWLRGLPFATLVSDFGSGTDARPIGSRLRAAPMICWEADFGDLAYGQVAAGARFFAVATDDAWFGESDGPFAQAQIAQLRAIETGRWIVRAAATGISGIIGPDGRWRARSAIDTQAVITGSIGEPQPTVYSRLGPLPVAAALSGIVLLGFALGRRAPR